MPATPAFGSRDLQVCAPGIGPDGDTPASSAYARRLFFDVSVVRACDLTGACDVDERADLAGGKLVVVNRCA